MKTIRTLGLSPFIVLLADPAIGQPANDIIVTGEKSARPLADTTSSVGVVTAEDIKARGLQALSDVVERSANVSSVYGASGFSIRGIANIGVSGAGEAATANIYVDEIPLAATFLHAAPTDLWDVQQVEIWRGPQSTLRGQNALAGAIIIQTADPSLGPWEARGRAMLTDEATRGIAVAVGGPLKEGEVAGRVAMELRRRDGFIRNLTRHTREDRESRDTIRAKLLWKPQGGHGLTFKLGYSHFRRRGGYFTVYARTDVADFLDNRVATDNVPNTTNIDFDGVSAEVRYEIASDFALVGATTWSGIDEVSQFDGDFGPANLAFSSQQRRYRTFTQELRLTFEGDRWNGVAGLYYFDRDLASHTQSRTNVPTPIATIATLLRAGGLNAAQANAIAAAYGSALPVIPVDFDGAFPTKVETAAAFADLRYRVTDRLSLLAGLRLDRYSGNNGTIQSATFVGRFPDPAAFGPLAPAIGQINAGIAGLVAQANASVPEARRRFTTVLPKAGLLVRLSEQLATALVVQRGYRPGGLSINVARGQAVPYDSEFTWNYELSLRSLLAGGRLRLNANAFYNTWRNQQVSVNFGLNSFDMNTVNAGRSHLYGLELDSSFDVIPSWALYTSVGYARTKFDRFDIGQPGVQSNLAGTEFAFAPHWTITAGTNFRLKNGIAAAVAASHSSKAFAAVGANQAAFPLMAHTSVDVRIGYDGSHWSAFLTARNLLDDNFIVFKSPAESRAVLSMPRVIGLEIQGRY